MRARCRRHGDGQQLQTAQLRHRAERVRGVQPLPAEVQFEFPDQRRGDGGEDVLHVRVLALPPPVVVQRTRAEILPGARQPEGELHARVAAPRLGHRVEGQVLALGDEPQDAALEKSLPALAQDAQGVGTELRVPPRAGVQFKQGGFLGRGFEMAQRGSRRWFAGGIFSPTSSLANIAGFLRSHLGSSQWAELPHETAVGVPRYFGGKTPSRSSASNLSLRRTPAL